MEKIIVCPHCGLTSEFKAFFWDGRDETVLHCGRCRKPFLHPNPQVRNRVKVTHESHKLGPKGV
jgi:hypothetical protein